MMDYENVLSLVTIQQLFNRFFRPGHKFYSDLVESWIVRGDATKRLFGITNLAYVALPSARDKHDAKKNAKLLLEDRFEKIFQRRHDCVHNCDRPRVAPQELSLPGTVRKVIEDVVFLVNRCDEHIHAEFPEFLLGCTRTVVAQCGY